MGLSRQIQRIEREIIAIDLAIDVLKNPGEAWDESVSSDVRGPIRILEEVRRKLKAKL